MDRRRFLHVSLQAGLGAGALARDPSLAVYAGIVGERHGLDALRAIDELAPDVAFLDIRMPGLNGLQLAAKLGSARRCASCASCASSSTPSSSGRSTAA